MTPPELEVVVAGTAEFSRALAGAVLARVGVLPRVAADPAEALVFARGPRALVVVEFLGEDTLSALKDLVLDGEGVRIVAAVPPARAGADEPLRALGVEPVRWTGAADPVLDAIERQLAAAAAPPAPATADRLFGGFDDDVLAAVESLDVPDAPASGASARPPRAPTSVAALFDDVAPASADEAAPAPSAPVAPPVDPGAAWPAAVPGPVEAADALGRALLGEAAAPSDSLAAVAAVTVANLSDLERAVFSGARPPVDPEPIRRAAVMRVRVAVALATAPGPGDPLDPAAVSAFLADLDALLSEVNALVAGAAPDAQASLEAIRNGLVREAIDFSEAAQRAAGAEGGAAVAPAPSRARTPHTRVVSISAAPATAPARPRAAWVVLAIAVALAGAFHGWRWWSAQARVRDVPRLPGALSDAIAPGGPPKGPGAPRVVTNVAGRAFDPAEVAAFVAEEAKKGYTVRELGPGTLLVVPTGAGDPPRKVP